MKWILCDDEPAQLHALRDFALEYAAARNINVQILEYDSCDNLWWDMESGLTPDLVLLDIQMDTPKAMSGMELAHRMRDKGMNSTICFLTGMADYVYEGYDVRAAGYILKPYSKEKVFAMLDRLNLTEEKNYHLLKSGRETYRIDDADVIALEASGRKTILYLKNRELQLHLTLADCVQQLGAVPLVRIHRSYLVHLGHIDRIGKDSCDMDNGHSFPIARGMRGPVTQAFIRYHTGEDHDLSRNSDSL